MATKMTPHIYVHKKLGFGRPADDPEVQSIVDEMHDTFDAAAAAIRALKAISANIPEMVLFDQRGKGLDAKLAQAAAFDIFSDDEKVAKAAHKNYKILWKDRNLRTVSGTTIRKASWAEFNQLIASLANNPFFSGGDPNIFVGDMTKLLEHLKPLPDSDTFEVQNFPAEVLDSWWDTKYPMEAASCAATVATPNLLPSIVAAIAPEPVKAASDGPVWRLTEPKRYQGYGKPLYDLLKATHIAGQPRPKPRDVLDAWKKNRPPEVTEVMVDGIKYYDANGNTKTADLGAIRAAINRMTQGK